VKIDKYVLLFDPAAISFFTFAATSCCFASVLAGLGPDVLRLTRNCCLLDFLGASAAPLLDGTVGMYRIAILTGYRISPDSW